MKKLGWARSVSICLAVLAVLIAAGFSFVSGEEVTFVSSKVEAALNGDNEQSEHDVNEQENNTTVKVEESSEDGRDDSEDASSGEEIDAGEEEVEKLEPDSGASDQGSGSSTLNDSQAENESAKSPEKDEPEQDSVNENSRKETQSLPVETRQEEPDAVPQTTAADETVEAAEAQEEAEPEPAPAVTYSWGQTSNYTFVMEVAVTNNGNSVSKGVSVSVPLLENKSPYQTTTLRSENFSSNSTSGRVHTYNIGDLSPGETKTIVAEFDIAVRTVSINSSNETIEKAKEAYNQYAGSGNCRTLARGFINKCREMGIEAREVIGFARPERGPMTSGSLAGMRHSWAEFYVDGLGWVPVDLTFQYFGELPHPSHVVESYSDQSIRVNYTGGSLSATWSNAIY